MKRNSSFGRLLSKFSSSPNKVKDKGTQPQQPPPAPDKRPVRLMPVGSGRSIEAATLGCSHVAVDGCISDSHVGADGRTARKSSIGVYFALDDTHCFIAHIECRLSSGASRMPSMVAYDALKLAVYQRLDTEARARGWPARTDAVAMGRMRGSLTMVCKDVDVQRQPVHDVYPGNVIAEAVNDWLQVPNGGRRAATQGVGFIVRHVPPFNIAQLLLSGTNAERWNLVELEKDDKWIIEI